MSGRIFNRHARRSGGYRPLQIKEIKIYKDSPNLSLPCYEGRHNDCDGGITFLPGKCECQCHKEVRHEQKD